MTLLDKILRWWFGPEFAQPVPASIPFAYAVLCLDCDHITASKNNHCDHCGANGAALMPLWSARLPLSVHGTRFK